MFGEIRLNASKTELDLINGGSFILKKNYSQKLQHGKSIGLVEGGPS